MLNKMIKETGIFLLIVLSTILIGTSTLFICKVSITEFHLPFFLITSGLFYYLLRKKEKWQDILRVILISLGIVVISTVISSFMFDRSSDGNTYHKDAIGVLKEGFNPVYESSSDFIVKRNDDSKSLTKYSIWIDHYAKGNWVIAANFYSLTGNVESGKAMNIISLYILFSFIFTTLIKKLNIKKTLSISLLAVLNPVTVAQVYTYYNDILVLIYLFLAILLLMKIDTNINDKESWLYYILSFIILANMKFNGLGYLLVFSFLFVCRYLYKAYKKKELGLIFKKLCIIFIPLFMVSLIVVGYPTYIKNSIDHQNPFFPLYDDNGEDIITQQQPKKFLEMNNIEKLFVGTFSKANNLMETDKTELKVPFMVSKSEIVPAMSNDLRISGWGIFFSGILIISIIILVVYYKDYKKESVLLFTLGITILLLIVMSESWWARYTPHFYLFAIFALYILLKYGKRKWLNIIFVTVISINTLIPLLGNTYYTLKNSIQITKDLKYLSSKEIEVNVNGMHGIIYNLKDFRVKYNITNNINEKELYYHYLTYKEK